MADFRGVVESPEHLSAVGGAAGRAPPSSVMSGPWDCATGLDQITVVRIDDTHIGEEQPDAAGFHEVLEYSVPAAEGEAAAEEEEDSVFVIEYSNPEEDGESYQFTVSVDRSLDDGGPSRPKRKLQSEEEEDEVLSNKSVLELGDDYDAMMKRNSKLLVCTLCPPPGKFFKRRAGLAVHLKLTHQLAEKKTFFCTSCQQTLRSQIELDAHTKRHANQDAVFTCHLCTPPGFTGSRMGLKAHLEKVHPGVVPRCHLCNRSFKSLVSYLADQFRHVGKSPYYCARCQIYEMTERGLSVHLKNHEKRSRKELQAPDASTNGSTNASTNGPTNASTNGPTNASTNASTNGSTNASTNGSSNASSNALTNTSTNGSSNVHNSATDDSDC